MIEDQSEEHDDNQLIFKRLIEMIDKVSQLRQSAKRAIRLSQQKIAKPFEDHEKFKIGETVLWWDKQREMSHSSKLEPKWKGPYEIVEVLPKGVYKLSYQGRTLKASVNGS